MRLYHVPEIGWFQYMTREGSWIGDVIEEVEVEPRLPMDRTTACGLLNAGTLGLFMLQVLRTYREDSLHKGERVSDWKDGHRIVAVHGANGQDWDNYKVRQDDTGRYRGTWSRLAQE